MALPLVLPPTVLGFYILVAIGPHSPLGQLIASLLYSSPFAVRPFAAAFAAVDWRLVEAS